MELDYNSLILVFLELSTLYSSPEQQPPGGWAETELMHGPVPSGPGSPTDRRRSGFTLIELLLVTVILGLLASITSPYFAAARERAIATQMQVDMRNMMKGVETYILLNGGQFPTNLETLIEGSTYNQTQDLEVCLFIAVPPSSFREGYIISMVGHPGTSVKTLMVYPLWGSEILEFDNGTPGC
jgi:prepilin-type N-terminal cleavage/methylation domain-containing protein